MDTLLLLDDVATLEKRMDEDTFSFILGSDALVISHHYPNIETG